MYIQKLNFPQILPDNEMAYLRHLEGILSSVDPDLSMILSKDRYKMTARISPSVPGAFDNILEEIKKFHTLLGIQVEFSKSMKAGANIYFAIDFQENR